MKIANAKLTPNKVREVRKGYRSGISQNALAERYGVARKTISNILDGTTWSHVKDDPDEKPLETMGDAFAFYNAAALLVKEVIDQAGSPYPDWHVTEKLARSIMDEWDIVSNSLTMIRCEETGSSDNLSSVLGSLADDNNPVRQGIDPLALNWRMTSDGWEWEF